MSLNEINWECRNQQVLDFINDLKEDMKIGILYNEYLKKFGIKFSYKTMQRIIEELAERELIEVKKVIGGTYGTTTMILKKNNKN